MEDATKFCPRCETVKPRSEYHRSRDRRGGLQAFCIVCHKKHKQEMHERNPEARRGWHLMERYGITLGEWKQMLEAQGYACAICRVDRPGGPGYWHTDHCHDTGQVRGLLCAQCNLRLGLIEDTWWHELAVRYLASAATLEN